MIWNPGIEQADRETIRSIQLKKLKTILIHARDNVPFYRERMAKAGFIPEDVTRLEDIQKLDFTVKTDFARPLSLRPVCRADGGHCAHSRVFRHPRASPLSRDTRGKISTCGASASPGW